MDSIFCDRRCVMCTNLHVVQDAELFYIVGDYNEGGHAHSEETAERSTPTRVRRQNNTVASVLWA